MSTFRLGVMLVVVAALVAVGLPALACSCINGDPRDRLVEADGAFVGELVSKQVDPNDQNKSTYTFRVIDGVKGRFEKTEEVHSATYGASCGLEMEPGQRAGLFLYKNRAGAWTSGFCSTISPGELREAAKPLPKPNGKGRARLLVGGSFGRARVMAINAAGKTIDYGFGGNEDLTDLGVCPGSRRTAEVTQRYNERRERWRTEIAVRALSNAREIDETHARFLFKKRYRYFWPAGIACQARDGSKIVMFVSEGYGAYTKSALAYVRDGRVTRIEPVTAREAEFGKGVVFMTAGKYGRKIVSRDLATLKKRTLVRGPRQSIELSLSPDGRHLAGVQIGNCGKKGCDPAQAVLVNTGSGKVRRKRIPDSTRTLGIAWWGRDRFVVTGVGRRGDSSYTYNLRLTRVGTAKDWYANHPVVVQGRLFGVNYGSLFTVRLPDGRVRRLGRLPSPVTNALTAIYSQ